MGTVEPVGQSGQESNTSETRRSGRGRSSARSGTALGGASQTLLCRREAAAAVDAYAVGLDVALVAAVDVDDGHDFSWPSRRALRADWSALVGARLTSSPRRRPRATALA
jgi:hypothetical protein